MSDGRFVVNASPLILLSKVGQLDCLKGLASTVVLPAAVFREVIAGDPSLHSLKTLRWLRIEPDLPLPEEIAGWDLGAGESQVLAYAEVNSQFEAVLDDLQARRCARALRILTTGTLGIILRAKKRGLVSHARPIVEELVLIGLYLGRDLIDSALAEVGE